MRRAVVKYYLFVTNAIVAQLVERHLAKVEIAGSSPVYRSFFCPSEDFRMGICMFVRKTSGCGGRSNCTKADDQKLLY